MDGDKNTSTTICRHPFCTAYRAKDELHENGDSCLLYGTLHLNEAVLAKIGMKELSTCMDVHELAVYGRKRKEDVVQMIMNSMVFGQGTYGPRNVDALLRHYKYLQKEVSQFEVTVLKAILLKYGVDVSDCTDKSDLVRKAEAALNDNKPDFFMGPSDGQPGNEDDDTDRCKICYENFIDCVLLQCGHLISCTSCARSFANCPMCDRRVDRLVRIYKS